MSNINYLVGINLNQNELQNAAIHNVGSDPVSGVDGQVIFNTTSLKYKIWFSSQWNELALGASTLPATTTTQGIVKISVVPASVGNPIAVGDNDPRNSDSRAPNGSAGGDLTGSTYPSPTIATVGGATAANIADAVTKRHTQNTDTGTTAQTFQLDSGSSGFKLKNSSGVLQVRNAADNAFADVRASNVTVEGNLTVNGTTTTVHSTSVETGDNIILLNSDISTSSGNTDGGIAVKILDTGDNTTRRDVQIYYKYSSNKWYSKFTDAASAAIDAQIPNKVVTTIGDGSTTAFTITHNLNTRDLTVAIRQAATPYAMIFTDIAFATVNTITATFATAPTTNQYTVTVIG